MQQIVLHIDNPKIEARLSDISRQKNIPVNNIISEMLEKYLYLYPVQQTNSETGHLLKEFDKLSEYNAKNRVKISENIDISELTNGVNDVIL